MKINEVFESFLFPELKKYLAENSSYNPQLVKVYTEESKVFPLVTMILTNSDMVYQNLSYGEIKEEFTIELNVYAVPKGNVSKRTIANEITNLIVQWFKENLHVQIDVREDFANIDNTVHRNYIKIKGVYNTSTDTIHPSLNDRSYYWK